MDRDRRIYIKQEPSDSSSGDSGGGDSGGSSSGGSGGGSSSGGGTTSSATYDTKTLAVLSVKNTPAERRLSPQRIKGCSITEPEGLYYGLIGELYKIPSFPSHDSLCMIDGKYPIRLQNSFLSEERGYNEGNEMALLNNSVNADIIISVGAENKEDVLNYYLYLGLLGEIVRSDSIDLGNYSTVLSFTEKKAIEDYGELSINGHSLYESGGGWILQFQYFPTYPSDRIDLSLANRNVEQEDIIPLLSRIQFALSNDTYIYAIDLDYTLSVITANVNVSQNNSYGQFNCMHPSLSLQNVACYTFYEGQIDAPYGNYPLHNLIVQGGTITNPTNEVLIKGGGFESDLDGNITLVSIDPLSSEPIMGYAKGTGSYAFDTEGHGFSITYTLPNEVDGYEPYITLCCVDSAIFDANGIIPFEDGFFDEFLAKNSIFNGNVSGFSTADLFRGVSEYDGDVSPGLLMVPETDLIQIAQEFSGNDCSFIRMERFENGQRIIQFDFDQLYYGDYGGTVTDVIANNDTLLNNPLIYCSVCWGGHVYGFCFNPPPDCGYCLPMTNGNSIPLVDEMSSSYKPTVYVHFNEDDDIYGANDAYVIANYGNTN